MSTSAPDQSRKRASTIDEFADRYGLCRQTIYNQARAGRLKIRKVGKRSVITTEDEQAWLQNLPVLT